MMSVPVPVPDAGARPRRHVPLAIASRPAGLVGLLIVLGVVLVAALAPWIATHDPSTQEIASRLQGPSSNHWLGTDQLGRDTFSRLVHGSRIALRVALPAVGLALLLGMIIGVVAGYAGGAVDRLAVMVLDVIQSFPAIILALSLLAVLGPSEGNVTAVVAVAFIPNYGRVARAQVISAKENQWVEAERSLGVGVLRLVLVHILPNIVAPIWVLVAMDIPAAIGIEAGLSFLGLGVPAPAPSWGVMLADGFSNVFTSFWGIVWASLMLMTTTLGFTLLGETMRDVLDPKLAGSRH
jgi:peptide/nickel transport system permease protein